MPKKTPPKPQAGIHDKRAAERVNAFIEQNARGKDFGSIEELNAFIGQLVGGKRIDDMELAPSTPAEAAQAKMYEAFDAQSTARRIALAKEALGIFSDCADAYVLLAEETDDLEKALSLYRQGVEAGKRALGDKYLEEHKGSLWMVNGRSYLRAMFGVANCLFELGQFDEATVVAKDILVLNQNDNQGVRYLLISSLIMSKKFAEAKKLLDKNKDDDSAHIQYSKALVLFQTGKKKAAQTAMIEALACNEFIGPLLLSPELVPEGELPDSYARGSFEEAVIYCSTNCQCWYEDIELFQWVKFVCSMQMLAMAADRREREEAVRRDRLESKRGPQKKGDNVLDLSYFLNDNR